MLERKRAEQTTVSDRQRKKRWLVGRVDPLGPKQMLVGCQNTRQIIVFRIKSYLDDYIHSIDPNFDTKRISSALYYTWYAAATIYTNSSKTDLTFYRIEKVTFWKKCQYTL